MIIISNCLKRFGYLFYMVSPEESSFEHWSAVPDYITEVIPYFVTLIVIEQIVCWCRGLPLIRVNDGITSLSQGIFMQLTKAAFESVALVYYVEIHRNWSIISLDWKSSTTWMIALVTVDLGFYWIHRITHEVNLLWGAHQVHHSSEEYNLTTALRQSVLHLLFQYMLYLPLALVIPPTTFLVHNQFNVLYQFWIHTQVINSLGPLEYILNTPSHHRVHHGRNSFCIDKNYGGVLIIWDRIFGTFQEEKSDISYGLTTNVNTFDPISIQFHHYLSIATKFNSVQGLENKIKSLFAGPGWEVGTGRLGQSMPPLDHSNHSNHSKHIKYDPHIPLHYKLYVLLHFAILVIIHTNLMQTIVVLSQFRAIVCSIYIFVSLTSFGLIMDSKKCSLFFEMSRCLAFFLLEHKIFNILMNETNFNTIVFIQYIYLSSLVLLFAEQLFSYYRIISANIVKVK